MKQVTRTLALISGPFVEFLTKTKNWRLSCIINDLFSGIIYQWIKRIKI